jgi:hypothetical protein
LGRLRHHHGGFHALAAATLTHAAYRRGIQIVAADRESAYVRIAGR